MSSPERGGRRRLGVLLLTALVAGCATARPDTRQLEAAIERFERAAAQAETAAAQAEASARQAEAAARAMAADSPSPTTRGGDDRYRHCADAGRGPVHSATHAARIAQAFLACLDRTWGEPVEITRVAADHYRVAYAAASDGDGGERLVFVTTATGRPDLAPSERP